MFASHYLLHTILSKAIADMLLMNGALTQHQCTVVVVVYNIIKLLGVNGEKNPSKKKKKLSITYLFQKSRQAF